MFESHTPNRMKVIFPLAGLGTRLMPLTAHQPKALVPVADKVMMAYAIEEAIGAGATEFIFVCSPEQMRFKKEFTATIPRNMKVRFEVQHKLNGNAVALVKTLPHLPKEGAALVLYPDDILTQGVALAKEAYRLARKTHSPVLLIDAVPWAKVSHYGLVGFKKTGGKYREISKIAEKPKRKNAPSNFTVVGHYALPVTFWGYLRQLCRKKQPPNGKEYGITDALKMYLADGKPIYGIPVRGERFDCGSHAGLIKANIYFGLRHRTHRKEMAAFVKKLKK